MVDPERSANPDNSLPYVETLDFGDDLGAYRAWMEDADARAREIYKTSIQAASPDNPEGQLMLELAIGRRQNQELAQAYDAEKRRQRVIDNASVFWAQA